MNFAQFQEQEKKNKEESTARREAKKAAKHAMQNKLKKPVEKPKPTPRQSNGFSLQQQRDIDSCNKSIAEEKEKQDLEHFLRRGDGVWRRIGSSSDFERCGCDSSADGDSDNDVGTCTYHQDIVAFLGGYTGFTDNPNDERYVRRLAMFK